MPTLSLDEAAALLKTTPETVSDCIQERGLRAARIGRAYVLIEADVVEWLRSQYITPEPSCVSSPVARWETKASPDDKPVQVSDSPTGKISNHAWRKACTRAGLPWLRFHDLRHTWASWHVQADTPLPVLKELGGWATLAMVERYAHLGVSHVATWAGNISTDGSNLDQETGTAEKKGLDRSKPLIHNDKLGWLMGLEPTTTGITRRSGRGTVLKINNLLTAKKRKTG